jgi:hypothetical protein
MARRKYIDVRIKEDGVERDALLRVPRDILEDMTLSFEEGAIERTMTLARIGASVVALLRVARASDAMDRKV